MVMRVIRAEIVSKINRNMRWITTAVMSFGDGRQGAVGPSSAVSGICADFYQPTVVSGLPDDVASVGAGHYHSLAVTSRGEVWAWGRNLEGQLGRPVLSPRSFRKFGKGLSFTWLDEIADDRFLVCPQRKMEPKRVEGLGKVRAKAAFASGVISTVIGDDGSLWVWGKSKRGQLGLGKGTTEAVSPTRVEALADEEIVKVSLGWGHALAQTKDGKLYGWGYSADGRLGNMGKPFETSPLDKSLNTPKPTSLSDSAIEAAEKLVLEGMEKEKDMPIVWEPCLVEEMCGVVVVDLACGLDHSLVLCCDGTLLSCGSNIYGQLGRKKEDLGLLPVDISFRPRSISCGLGHSFAICQIQESTKDTEGIVSWGWNQSSQLGRRGPANTPLVIDELIGEDPISVHGGRAHSLSLTSKGELYVWGSGRNGRLGLGSSMDEGEPSLVEDFEGYKIVQAVAGFDHNLVLVSK